MATPQSKKRNGIILAVLLALAAFAFGIFNLVRTDIDCGGDAMTADDICQETKNGSTTDYTYDDIKSQQSRTGYIALGVGVVILAYAGWQIVSYRKTAAEPPAVASA